MNSRTAAHFQALSSLLWPLFLVWSVLGVMVMPLHPWSLSQEAIREDVANPGLRDALLLLFQSYDALWVFLAAAVAYSHTAACEGLPAARRGALLGLGGAALLCGADALTGWPLGPLAYTDLLGKRIAHLLPLAVPLLWLTIFLCSRATVLMLPRAIQWPRWQVALGTALLVWLTDFNLEPVAWKVRAWWIWYPGEANPPAIPPMQNFAVWFCAAFLWAIAIRPSNRVPVFTGNRWKPVVILGLLNLLALAFHWLRW
jgi:uncharacterized membrane protein